MALASWPAGFPTVPLRDGTGIKKLHQAPIQTEMDDGPVRKRRRSTTTWSELTLRFALTHAQYAEFQVFVRDTLNHGAAAFRMPVWRPNWTAPFPVKTCKFIDEVSYEITLPWIYVTLPLQVRDWAAEPAWLIPEAVNGLDFDFANARYWLDGAFSAASALTVARATTGMAQKADGSWVSFAANVPRITDKGLLIEEARTNLCLWSDDFSNGTAWTTNNPVTSNQIAAPDGSLTADLITSGNVTSQGTYQTGIPVTAGTQYTFSIFVRLGTLAASAFKIAFYDATAGAFIASDILPTQTPSPDGWTRVIYTLTTPAGCTSLRVYPFRNSAAVPGTFYLWGAQLEQGTFASSPIRTTGVAATRAMDLIHMTNTIAGLDAAHTLYAQVIPLSPSTYSSNQTYAQIDNGRLVAYTGRTSIYREQTAGSGGFLIQDVSAQAQSSDARPIAAGARQKIAVTAAPNDFIGASGGILFGADSAGTVPAGLNAIRFGNNSGQTWGASLIERIVVAPSRLSNARLQSLTA